MSEAVAQIKSQHGIRAIVNNAAASPMVDFLEADLETFDLAMDVNVRAMFALTQRVATVLADQRRGVIVNLSSVHAHQGVRGMSIYAATKGAIEALTRVVAAELATSNVRCNAVAPSATSTT